MTKLEKVGLAIVALGIAGLYYFLIPLHKPTLGSGGGSVDTTNFLNTVNHSVTTTYSGPLPVKILAADYNRQYAHIENDSATVVYIFLQTFSGATTSTQESAASTTVGINKGIRLPANGGSYDIKPENLYPGDVYASSTLGGLKILTTYK